ncbi:MAG: hypothetical protein NVS3B12_28330 [Acidimicrobiales bacterium]
MLAATRLGLRRLAGFAVAEAVATADNCSRRVLLGSRTGGPKRSSFAKRESSVDIPVSYVRLAPKRILPDP